MGGVTRAAYVLLPPSESKEPGGRLQAAPGLFDVALGPSRSRVLQALGDLVANATPQELSKVLRVRGALLERAREATRHLVAGTAPSMPAWQRYNGVVWSHLDPGSLKERQRGRILIPSGLYGLSSATDLIGDYRLTMKAALGGLGSVTSFWRPTLVEVLEQMEGASFVNLLPREHYAAIDGRVSATTRMVHVAFLRDGGRGVAGHDAKAVKGLVARRVLEDGIEAIGDFRWRRWRGRRREGRYEVVESPLD